MEIYDQCRVPRIKEKDQACFWFCVSRYFCHYFSKKKCKRSVLGPKMIVWKGKLWQHWHEQDANPHLVTLYQAMSRRGQAKRGDKQQIQQLLWSGWQERSICEKQYDKYLPLGQPTYVDQSTTRTRTRKESNARFRTINSYQANRRTNKGIAVRDKCSINFYHSFTTSSPNMVLWAPFNRNCFSF